jgi:hypothetical protein
MRILQYTNDSDSFILFSKWRLTGKGFTQYGYLKNVSLAFALLLTKDKQYKTF